MNQDPLAGAPVHDMSQGSGTGSLWDGFSVDGASNTSFEKINFSEATQKAFREAGAGGVAELVNGDVMSPPPARGRGKVNDEDALSGLRSLSTPPGGETGGGPGSAGSGSSGARRRSLFSSVVEGGKKAP